MRWSRRAPGNCSVSPRARSSGAPTRSVAEGARGARRAQHQEWLPLVREARAAGSARRRPPRARTDAEEQQHRARRPACGA
eukprot:11939961-Alexandrium_andersonii.AAC.1